MVKGVHLRCTDVSLTGSNPVPSKEDFKYGYFYYIYKIYCDSLSDIYIGSTNNLNRKIVDHKKDCYNKNVAKYNNKLYTFIRDKGGFDNWKFEILETLESSNEERKKKEQYYINKLNPSLNTYRAYRSIDDLQEFKRIKSHRQ